MEKPDRPIYSPTALRRALLAIGSIVIVLIVGIVGFHYIEGMDYVNALYFESMLATGQGPPLQLNTDAGKVFASVMAFVSVGSVITSLVFTLGPILNTVLREGLERTESEVRKIEKEIEPKKKED
jgi:hypothetical protein